MAPKKSSGKSTAAATGSPRKTRSATSGKRVEPPPAAPAKPPAKKARVAKEKKAEDVAPAPAAGDDTSVAIVVEACNQCYRFKTRANTVKEGLESAIPGIEVTINPEKPRRGCFEVRKASGEIFISLLDLKRPFTKMTDLDMDQVVKDIIAKIK